MLRPSLYHPMLASNHSGIVIIYKGEVMNVIGIIGKQNRKSFRTFAQEIWNQHLFNNV